MLFSVYESVKYHWELHIRCTQVSSVRIDIVKTLCLKNLILQKFSFIQSSDDGNILELLSIVYRIFTT